MRRNIWQQLHKETKQWDSGLSIVFGEQRIAHEQVNQSLRHTKRFFEIASAKKIKMKNTVRKKAVKSYGTKSSRDLKTPIWLIFSLHFAFEFERNDVSRRLTLTQMRKKCRLMSTVT